MRKNKYNEVMELILNYGDAKLNIGLAIASDFCSEEKMAVLDKEKTAILDKICDAIIELTKDAEV